MVYIKTAGIAVLSLFLLTSGKSHATKKMPDNTYRWVISETGLVMRNAPSLHGKKTGLIPYKAKVKLIEEESVFISIQGVSGKWSKVAYQAAYAWVFGGYLSERPVEGKVLYGLNPGLATVGWTSKLKNAPCGAEGSLFFDNNGKGFYFHCGEKLKVYCAVNFIIKNEDHHYVKCNPLVPIAKLNFPTIPSFHILQGAASGIELDLMISADYTPSSIKCASSMVSAQDFGEFSCFH